MITQMLFYKMRKIILLFCLFINNVYANSTLEINQLFQKLAQSNCSFERNGSWYNSKEAIKHLNRKYDYLIKRNLVKNTESFIEYAGTKSSISGKEYHVKCNNKISTSKEWFISQLKLIRQNNAQ